MMFLILLRFHDNSFFSRKEARELRVRINAIEFNAGEDSVSQEVLKIFSHKNYDPIYLFNNVALLILKEQVELGDTIQPLCLPNQDQVFDEQSCIFSHRDHTEPEGKLH